MKRIVRLTESDLVRIVKRVLNEQPTKTKMGDFEDVELLSTACLSWSRMSEKSKKQYMSWSKNQIGSYPYNPDVACKSKASVSIGSDGDRKMLKAIIDLDFL
jgi:hypothetical protein